MKKLVFFAFIFTLLYFTFPLVGEGKQDNEEYQVIPDDAIRLRILANSDDEVDQEIKQVVRDRVNEEITSWVENITDIDEARNLIQERIPEIDRIVDETLAANRSEERRVGKECRL